MDTLILTLSLTLLLAFLVVGGLATSLLSDLQKISPPKEPIAMKKPPKQKRDDEI